MDLKLLNDQGQAATFSAPDTVFGRDFNEALVHQIVVAFQANARSGNRAQKDRAEVKHSTKKPWRQKGTGRARAGMTSSPLWRGVVARSRIRLKRTSAGRSTRRCTVPGSARSCRSWLVKTASPWWTPSLESPKTKLAAAKLKTLGLDSVLIITDTVDENVYLATRNLPHVAVVEPRYADPLSLIHYKKVLITKPAIAQLEEMLG